MRLPSYPKILQLGHHKIQTIFNGEVEVTEKIDGSQFSFGVFNGELICRSKGAQLVVEAPDKLFRPAVEHVLSVKDKLPENHLFFGETLSKPRHNVLEYSRVPRGNIMLFGLYDGYNFQRYESLVYWAHVLQVEVVPLIYQSKEISAEDIVAQLDRESVLGGSQFEGVVVKNYDQPYFITADVLVPFMAGKYVSEKFKEKHGAKAYGKRETKESLDEYFKQFRTEARWRKAIQHLRELGHFETDPRSIGPLIKEINRDLLEEEKEEIKDRLWKEYEKQILRTATAGFPEWFKEQLLKGEI